MTQTRCKRIYGILLSAVTVIAGLCLMAACWGIYRSGGEQTYTPQKVAEAFSSIAVPVYLCLVLVIGGWILNFALPEAQQRPKREKNRANVLQLLHAKADLTQAAPELQTAIVIQQKRRKCHAMISGALLALGSVIFLAYALNSSNFDRVDITGSVISAMWVLIPCLAIPFGYAVFSAYYTRRSMDKEIALLKQVGTYTNTPVTVPEAAAGKWESVLRYGLLCLAVGLMVYGFVAGGWADVLTKAVNICTECVGLG